MRTLRSWIGVLSMMVLSFPTLVQAQGGPPGGGSLVARVAALEADVLALQTALATLLPACLTTEGDDVVFEGCNVHIRSGSGATDGPVNGTGNLIIGHNEDTLGDPNARTGSHNLIVGSEHEYTSFGGLVAGFSNTVSGEHASVCGGSTNEASGDSTSVSGGQNNEASEEFASVSGGGGNLASGRFSSVSGGQNNEASGRFASVSGGGDPNSLLGNVASGPWSSINGGFNNSATHSQSTVSGGTGNLAGRSVTTISGGVNNQAIHADSTVSGGINIVTTASGDHVP